VSEDGGFFYDYASYEDGASQIGQAGNDLATAGDDYAAVQGQASAQLRQWPPTVPVADTLDQVEAKLAEAIRLGADDLRWTSDQLTAARDTMLEAEGNNTALAQRAVQDLRDSDLSPLDGDATAVGQRSRIEQLLNPDGASSGYAADIRTFGSNDEGAMYGRSTWSDAQGRLPAEQREALWGYSGEKAPGSIGPPDYKEINGFLRDRSPGSAEISESVDSLDQALGIKPVPEDLVVIRETGSSAFDMPVEQLPGSVQHEPGYLSTALGPDPTFDPSATKPVLHLEVPAETPAMYMDGVSQFPSERELLLGRGLSYQVDRVENVAGRWHIFGRIIP
jgi:hypothetical protein